MSGRLKINLIFLIVAVMLVSAFLATPSGAVGGDGISVSRYEAERGDRVRVYINIPALSNHADALWIKVSYDTSVFERPSSGWYSWGTLDVSGRGVKTDVTEYGSGIGDGRSFVAFAASAADHDGSRLIPVDNSQRLWIDLIVKNTAALGDSVIRLETHDVAYTNDDGATYTDMWVNPAVTEATVTVTPPSSVFASGGGITTDKGTLVPGDTFYVNVTIPKMGRTAIATDVIVGFDPSAFTFLGLETHAYAGVRSDSSHFGISTNRCIDNTVLRAKMRVNTDAKPGNYEFELTEYSLHYYDGITKVEMWTPDITEAPVTVLDVSSYPSSSYGISVSPVRVNQRELFDVMINIPPMNTYATKMDIRVEYDSRSFELLSWDPGIGTLDNGRGYFGFKVSGGNIDLRSGFTFTARMRSASYALNRYTFTLSHHVVANEYVANMWRPSASYTYVYVYKGDAGDPSYDPAITIVTERAPATDAPFTSKDTRVTVSDADTTRPINGGSNVYDDDDSNYNNDNNRPISNFSDDDTTLPAGRDINIYLDASLKNVAVSNINIATKKKFFLGDTTVYLRNTARADKDAKNALAKLGMSGHSFYAFDMSVYDMETGVYKHKLTDGYIDLTIPLPGNLSGSKGKIAVYHIRNNVPEPVKATVSTRNGQYMVKFRTNSYSPYMLVDLLSGNTSGNTYTPSDKTGNYNITGDRTGNYTAVDEKGGSNIIPADDKGGSLISASNPHTGIALAIIVPTAMAGCVVLVRKEKRRRNPRK